MANRRSAGSAIGAMRRAAIALSITAVLAGCTRAREDTLRAGDTAAAAARPDSIVLERTVCFGFCPAYRVSLAASGTVRFERLPQRQTPGDTAQGTFDAEGLDSLLAQARAIGFFALPDEITPGNPAACPVAATDHPSAIVTIAVGDTIKRVNHYHGCHAEGGMNPTDAYPRLTELEAAIDSAAGVAGWLERSQR